MGVVFEFVEEFFEEGIAIVMSTDDQLVQRCLVMEAGLALWAGFAADIALLGSEWGDAAPAVLADPSVGETTTEALSGKEEIETKTGELSEHLDVVKRP